MYPSWSWLVRSPHAHFPKGDVALGACLLESAPGPLPRCPSGILCTILFFLKAFLSDSQARPESHCIRRRDWAGKLALPFPLFLTLFLQTPLLLWLRGPRVPSFLPWVPQSAQSSPTTPPASGQWVFHRPNRTEHQRPDGRAVWSQWPWDQAWNILSAASPSFLTPTMPCVPGCARTRACQRPSAHTHVRQVHVPEQTEALPCSPAPKTPSRCALANCGIFWKGQLVGRALDGESEPWLFAAD